MTTCPEPPGYTTNEQSLPGATAPGSSSFVLAASFSQLEEARFMDLQPQWPQVEMCG
jgi:hypothetical protein